MCVENVNCLIRRFHSLTFPRVAERSMSVVAIVQPLGIARPLRGRGRTSILRFWHEPQGDCRVSAECGRRLLCTTTPCGMDETNCQPHRSAIQTERPESQLSRQRRFQRGWGSGQSCASGQRAQSEVGFFVCLTTGTACDWHRLEDMDIAFLDVMGIAKVKPGEYKTAAAKVTGSAGKMNQKVKTKRDAVEFFKVESASSVYVYNPVTRKFVSVATSD